jgi:hypothetical protein
MSLLDLASSARLGRPVKYFIPERPDAFIFGTRSVFVSAAPLCLAAIALILARGLKSDR